MLDRRFPKFTLKHRPEKNLHQCNLHQFPVRSGEVLDGKGSIQQKPVERRFHAFGCGRHFFFLDDVALYQKTPDTFILLAGVKQYNLTLAQ